MLLAIAGNAVADTDPTEQPHDEILAAAREHVLDQADRLGGKIEVTALPLDRRLRLARCELPLQTYDSPNGLKPGRSVVGVRCNGNQPWKIYVSVRIASLQPVVVSTAPLPRGHLIGADDVALVERDGARLLRGFFSDPDQVVGQRAKRHIGVGRVITPSTLAQDQLIRRGAEVEILARDGNLQVRMKGEAMSNGALGERIRVRNRASGRIVTGTVVDAGVILVQE